MLSESFPTHDERVSMTTPDQITPGQSPSGQSPSGDPGGSQGAWGAVARLLSLQLLTVIAVTAVITGVYALTGPHKSHQVTAGSAAPASAATTSGPAASTPAASTPPANTPAASTPPASPTASPAASPTAPASSPASRRPEAARRLKVDVLNQSGPGGTAAKTASRVRALGWTVGRVSDFRGNVTATTVYYPTGEAKAAHALSGALPGKPRVLPRFSTLADKRLTIIVTR
jgi:pyruvate/2-oxoglutarate dehydrogenase complex dihydrolipoamide acyltransferase (E2) component